MAGNPPGDVIPLVDSRFRTDPRATMRALAGSSMGAFQTLWYGLAHPNSFGSLGLFSGGGAPGKADEPPIARYAAARKNSGGKFFQVFSIPIGAGDMNRGLTRTLDAALTANQAPHEYLELPNHGHTWPFWRQRLADLLPQLFASAK